MLIEIFNAQDDTKLLQEIEKFEMIHSQNAYLFMNQETLNELTIFFPLKIHVELKQYSDSVFVYYCGRRVYENDTLKFGEVEIR